MIFKRFLCASILAAGIVTGKSKAASVFPVSTNSSVLQLCGGVTTDGTNFLAGLIVGTNVCSQLFSPTGALIGPLLTLGKTGSNSVAGAVCFGRTNYFGVWSDSTARPGVDMFGQFGSPTGTKIGGTFPLLASVGAYGFQAVRALAFDGTNFLLVWQDTNSTALYGGFVTQSGSLSGAPFVISSQSYNGGSAVAAFGATNYLVAWQNGTTSFQTYCARVSTAGVVSAGVQLSQTFSLDQNNLAIAFDGTNFLVVWNRDSQHSAFSQPIDWDVYGRFVSPTGTLPGSELQIVTDAGNQSSPALAFDGVNYLLEWTDFPSSNPTNSTLRAKFLTRAGAAAGPEITLMTAQGTNQPFFAVNGVVYGGSRYAVVGTLGTLIVGGFGAVTGVGSAVVYGTTLPAGGTPPMLTLGTQTNKTQMPLTLNGTPGINYAIQSNTNWTGSNWVSLVTNSPTNGPFSFIDTHTTNANKYYRAVKQ